MNYPIVNTTTDYFSTEQQLNQLEKQLAEITLPTREDWRQILNGVNALQYNPEDKQQQLRAEIQESLKHRHRISDLLLSAFERDQDRIQALGDFARENIMEAMKSPLPVVPNQIFSNIRSLIDGIRTLLQQEIEIVIPMIQLYTAIEIADSGWAENQAFVIKIAPVPQFLH